LAIKGIPAGTIPSVDIAVPELPLLYEHIMKKGPTIGVIPPGA
jgi:hypothetical protein